MRKYILPLIILAFSVNANAGIIFKAESKGGSNPILSKIESKKLNDDVADKLREIVDNKGAAPTDEQVQNAIAFVAGTVSTYVPMVVTCTGTTVQGVGQFAGSCVVDIECSDGTGWFGSEFECDCE